MEGGASPAPPPAPPPPPGHAFLGMRLRRGVGSGGRDGGPSTPAPTWKLLDQLRGGGEKGSSLARPSARMLAAGLWELNRREPARMISGGRRHRRREMAVAGVVRVAGHPSSYSPGSDQLLNASSLRRRRHRTAASIEHNHRTAAKNSRALKSLSPASNGSLMKIAAYNPPLTPNSSVGYRGVFTETGDGLRTSTELLKVLNRIWNLEEQHTSSVAMVKELIIELDHSQRRVQEMMQKHQADRKEIDELVNKLTKIKVSKKTKEEEKTEAAIQSLKDELQEEKKLRRRSEGLHRKLSKKFFQVNASFSNAFKELEKERIGRALLEELCDEFAEALKFYEKEMRSMGFSGTEDDALIMLVAEAWLHEREQIKQAEAGRGVGKETSVNHLKRELVDFFKSKQDATIKNEGPSCKYSKSDYLRRASLESIHLNGAHSAPQDVGDEDSLVSEFHHLNLNNAYAEKEVIPDISDGLLESGILAKPKWLDSRSKVKSHSLQQPESNKLVEERKSYENRKNKFHITYERSHETADISGPSRPIFGESNGHLEDDREENVEIGCLSREEHSTMNFGNDFTGAGLGIPSPVRQWKLHQDSPETIKSECCSRGMKESTLKAKLLEARLEAQYARLRNSKLYK